MSLVRFLFRNLPRLFRRSKTSHLFAQLILFLLLSLFFFSLKISIPLFQTVEKTLSREYLFIFLSSENWQENEKKLSSFLSRKIPSANRIVHPPEKVFRDLKEVLKMEGGEEEILKLVPAVMEITLEKPIPSSILSEIQNFSGVLLIDQGGGKIKEIQKMAYGGKILLLLFLTLLLTGVFFILLSTLSLLLNDFREEIELMNLLGTPHGWIYSLVILSALLHSTLSTLLSYFFSVKILSDILAPWILFTPFSFLAFPSPPPPFSLLLPLVVSGIAGIVRTREFLKATSTLT